MNQGDIDKTVAQRKWASQREHTFSDDRWVLSCESARKNTKKNIFKGIIARVIHCSETKEVELCLAGVALHLDGDNKDNKLRLAERQEEIRTYVSLEKVDADIDAFDNVLEIGLEDERVARRMQHPRRVLQLQKITQSPSDRVFYLYQSFLHRPENASSSSHVR